MDNNDNNNNEGKKRPQFYESSVFPLPPISAKHLAASGRGDQDSCNKLQLQFLQSVLPGCQKQPQTITITITPRVNSIKAACV